jgi:hypothetical protein
MANPCAKTRPYDRPYEIWATPIGNIHVLKKYKSPEGEAKDPYARWLTFVDNEYQESGDQYAADIKRYGVLIHTDY